jgi:transposase-like protein
VFARKAKSTRRKHGSTWHMDEVFVTLGGEPYLLWRAVDEHGAELDALAQKRRDKSAAMRFFRRLLRSNPCQAGSSPISCAAIRPRRRISRSSLALGMYSSRQPRA